MARQLRIQYKDAWYHVMNRGQNKRNIFICEKHRNIFMKLLREITEKYKVEIHGYCLMNNHFHLMIKTPLANLDSAMRHLSSSYVIKFNLDTERDGSLFKDRYKAILVNGDSYLMELSRYIHKNPSKAGIVEEGKDKTYKWSSYRFYLDKTAKPDWLKTEMIDSLFQNNPKKYEAFIDKEISEEIKIFYSQTKIKPILGSQKFIEKITKKFFGDIDPNYYISEKKDIIENKYPDIHQVTEIIAKHYKTTSNEIIHSPKSNSTARKMAIYINSLNPRYNLKEVGEYFKISRPAVSLNKIRFKEEIARNKQDNESYKKIKPIIKQLVTT